MHVPSRFAEIDSLMLSDEAPHWEIIDEDLEVVVLLHRSHELRDVFGFKCDVAQLTPVVFYTEAEVDARVHAAVTGQQLPKLVLLALEVVGRAERQRVVRIRLVRVCERPDLQSAVGELHANYKAVGLLEQARCPSVAE